MRVCSVLRRRLGLGPGLLVCLLAWQAARPCRTCADSAGEGVPATEADRAALEPAPLEPVTGDDGPRLEWRGRRFGSGQYALTGTLLAGTLGLTFSDPDLDYSWGGGVLFDGPARRGLRAGSEHGREVAGKVSDALLYALIGYPVLVDAGLLAGAVHRSPDVMGQMLLIDSQAFLLTSFVTQLTKFLSRRNRPKTLNCPPDDEECRDDPVSFFSGHTSMAFTGAGLVCAHATNLPLYGSEAAGNGACFSALGAATAVGALRIVADEHFSSDVLIGAAVGLLSGYFLPKWLHYDLGQEPADPAVRALGERDGSDVHQGDRSSARHVLGPLASPSSAGLSYQAIW